MIRAVGGVATAVALVVGTAAFADAQLVAERTPGSIGWAPCAGVPDVECGSLRLPVDWAKPGGGKFGMAVARRTATDQAHRIGVLVVNPGGPGGSGVEFAEFAPEYFSPEVLARFDIVGFDPRGVGASLPAVCSADLLQSRPSSHLASQRDFNQYLAYTRTLNADCRQRSGPVYDHADTLAVVDDVDALRVALGEKKISYYGVSYGTLLGQQYAERYGRNLRAMVIDSNMDHTSDAERFTTVSAATAEDSLREFAKWCDRAASCALHGKNVLKEWDKLLARADRGQVIDSVDPNHHLSVDEITSTAFSAFYGPQWTELADWLVSLRTTPRPVAYAAGDSVPTPFAAVFCQDWSFRPLTYRDYVGLDRAANQVAPHMRGSALATLGVLGCAGVPDPANNPQRKLDIRAAPQILMLNSLHDPATSYDWAVNVHRQTRNTTTLLTYDGWGHGAYNKSSCVMSTTDAYLTTLRTPRDGTHCPAVEPSPSTAQKRTAAVAPTRPLPVGPVPGLPGWGI
ncbi:alpha/beta hydrolase [Actinokineospora inagensis]|uniref:alpha/beta hydrolase n=1 Tax=Actinokineospora inagensis TaxID=103730 RepID=UPI001FE2084B|nr:alpha/beta hydrolase [Actinokineospora inagensis]